MREAPKDRGATIVMRPLTAEDRAHVPAENGPWPLGGTLIAAAMGTVIVALVVTPCLVLPALIHLFTGSGERFEPAVYAAVVAIGFPVTLAFCSYDLVKQRRRLSRVRRKELSEGRVRTFRGTADRAWICRLDKCPSLTILRVSPSELLVVQAAPEPPLAMEIGREIVVDELPLSGDILRFAASGPRIPLAKYTGDIRDIWLEHSVSLVPAAEANGDLRRLLESPG